MEAEFWAKHGNRRIGYLAAKRVDWRTGQMAEQEIAKIGLWLEKAVDDDEE